MRPFNLEEYLANPSKKVITRDGKNVRIVCSDRLGEFPVIALWSCKDDEGNPYERVNAYTTDGRYSRCFEEAFDLFFAPEKKEGWFSIYRTESGDLVPGRYIDESEKISKERRAPNLFSVRVATVKIEWEE